MDLFSVYQIDATVSGFHVLRRSFGNIFFFIFVVVTIIVFVFVLFINATIITLYSIIVVGKKHVLLVLLKCFTNFV